MLNCCDHHASFREAGVIFNEDKTFFTVHCLDCHSDYGHFPQVKEAFEAPRFCPDCRKKRALVGFPVG